jgi:transitional endoplasmic reticulum ATPase
MSSREPVERLSLTVAEATARDVGRGSIRLDPHDMKKLGVLDEDVVEVFGQRPTVARALTALGEKPGRGVVQMDGIVRANAGARLDEEVTVCATDAQPARSILLAPLEGARPVAGGQGRTIALLLEGIPVVVGDTVRVDSPTTLKESFSIVKTWPSGPVQIGAATKVRSETEAFAVGDRAALTYEDVGGLKREIMRIREMIELPLEYPEVFDRLGVEPPKGVLLHGPPGTGKTLIARAVAYETSAHFLHIDGPEIMDKYYGASEARLRDVFEDAKLHAPSIIFIDEIDALAPKREEVGGDRQVERRLVAQLLALMDGLETRGKVIVVGATNVPNLIDPALRRPGRFDREVEIDVPERVGRAEVLEIHTRGMPLASDVDLHALAVSTHGFVGADLAALCREAAMCAVRRLMPEIDFAQSDIPYDRLMALEVTAADFMAARGEVEPSALREVFSETPDVTWDDVGGLTEVKQLLREAVQWPLKYRHLFDRAGVPPARGILLHGPSGTGKTLIVKALARESEINFISIKGPQLLSMWAGESERGAREVFRRARQVAPCILFFDEIDALAATRGSEGAAIERVVSQLLTELDGVEDIEGVMVLAATNRLDMVDTALLRAGRFDFRVELPVPDAETRLAILKVHTRHMPLVGDVDLEALAAATDGLVGADIGGVCRRAVMLAIREFLEVEGRPVKELRVGKAHFDAALAASG